jgi:hypothetical protein
VNTFAISPFICAPLPPSSGSPLKIHTRDIDGRAALTDAAPTATHGGRANEVLKKNIVKKIQCANRYPYLPRIFPATTDYY